MFAEQSQIARDGFVAHVSGGCGKAARHVTRASRILCSLQHDIYLYFMMCVRVSAPAFASLSSWMHANVPTST